MKYNKIIIYGGTSEISLSLVDMYINECEKLIISYPPSVPLKAVGA